MKTRIHINKHRIAQNAKDGGNRPAITAKTYQSNEYGHRANIYDDQGNVVASVIQADGENIKPLSCGAKIWIECEGHVEVLDNAYHLQQ